MALKKSDLDNLVVDLTIPYPALNGELCIGYKPAQLYGDGRILERRIRRAGIGVLADLLAHWDVLGDDEQPLPINIQTVTALPFMLLLPLWEAIFTDFRTRYLQTGAGDPARGPDFPRIIRHLLEDVDWGDDDETE